MENIRRILREETEVIPSFIKRRIGGYVNNILLVYGNYNLKGNFKNLIDEISDVIINDLLSDYIDSIGYTVDDEDDNYDQSVVDKIYDKYYNLLKDHIQGNYSDEIYKLYLKNKKWLYNMNIQENIRRVLRDTNRLKGPREMPNELKRRLQRLDDLIVKVIEDIEVCKYNTPDEFIYAVVDELIWELRDDYHGDLNKLDKFDVTHYAYDYKYHELEDYYRENCE